MRSTTATIMTIQRLTIPLNQYEFKDLTHLWCETESCELRINTTLLSISVDANIIFVIAVFIAFSVSTSLSINRIKVFKKYLSLLKLKLQSKVYFLSCEFLQTLNPTRINASKNTRYIPHLNEGCNVNLISS